MKPAAEAVRNCNVYLVSVSNIRNMLLYKVSPTYCGNSYLCNGMSTQSSLALTCYLSHGQVQTRVARCMAIHGPNSRIQPVHFITSIKRNGL